MKSEGGPKRGTNMAANKLKSTNFTKSLKALSPHHLSLEPCHVTYVCVAGYCRACDCQHFVTVKKQVYRKGGRKSSETPHKLC